MNMQDSNYYNYNGMNQNDCDYDPYGDTGVLSKNSLQRPTETLVNVNANTVEMTCELLRLNTGERFRIEPNSCLVIGRAQQAVHICVNNNPSVSNQHIQLNSFGGVCYAIDLKSRNGTFVNDNRLIPGVAVILNHGDYVTLGNEIFRFI